MSKIMKSDRKNFDLPNEPLRSNDLRSLSAISDGISLKKKFVRELASVSSAIKKLGGVIPAKERCRNACSIEQKQIPADRKLKSTEINKGLKNANATSKVPHLCSDVSVAKSKGPYFLKEISKNSKPSNIVQMESKNSLSKQKKPWCSDTNELKSVVDARKKNPQPRTQPKKSCDVGTKGYVDPLHKLEQISSLKDIHIAKLESRSTKANLKAQRQQKKTDEKRRALRIQREKDKLEKQCAEEKARIEAKLDAAKSVALKARFELKMKIKKEREASRLAFQKMEATIEFNDFNQIVKELKRLGCENTSFYALRELGLVLKDDDFDDH